MSIHASHPEDVDTAMTLAARLPPLPISRRKLRRNAVAAGPRDISSQWLLGIGAIVVAAILFLTSALSLGVMLDHLRQQMQRVEHVQTVILQTHSVEEDLEDARAAARYSLRHGGGLDMDLVRIEGRNAARGLGALISIVPDEAATLKAIAQRIDGQMAALSSGIEDNGASRAIAAFRAKQSAAYEASRAAVDRNILFFIAFASAMALIGPGLGLVGIMLLQRERSSRRTREMQKELMHVQRLAVMGETAAMLAHEVSHPLTAAGNYLSALRRSSAKSDTVKAAELSDRAAQQIHRAATILHRLRRFIEKRDTEHGPVAPEALVHDAVALVGPLDGDVTLIAAADPDLPDVTVDRIQIQQVLVNLIRNAIEAMQGCAVRRLIVTAAALPSSEVEFSLTDTGRGLPADVAAKLFQPFVSTKKEGMGVGLSICRSIITAHRGSISAEPNPQGGTVFRFRLPVA
jgi:C4-dicarboxylate-specific signal transduction histidine kinase